MEEYLYNAREELKRVDHLIYVSLKYTRTCDVIKSVVNRLIQAYDCVIEGLLAKLKFEKKIDEIPALPGVRIDLILKSFPDDTKLVAAAEFYIFLRKVNNTEFTTRMEFRRNVTMTVKLENIPVEITIDTVMEYYKQTLAFMEYIQDHNILKTNEPKDSQ